MWHCNHVQGAVKISCARQDPNARNCHGYRKFVKRSVLESPQNGYMANDTIVIRYTIELVVSSGGALSGHKAPGNLAKPSVIQVRQLPHRLSHTCYWQKVGVAGDDLACYSTPFPAHVQAVSIYCPGALDWDRDFLEIERTTSNKYAFSLHAAFACRAIVSLSDATWALHWCKLSHQYIVLACLYTHPACSTTHVVCSI